jgi:hypothetical protein
LERLLVRRAQVVEQLLEALLATEALAIALAGGDGFPLRPLAEVAAATPVGVAWERSPEHDDLPPAQTGLTESLIADLLVALQDRGPVQWRNAGAAPGAGTHVRAPRRTVALTRGASPVGAEALLQRRLAIEPPALPTGAPGALAWAPAETQILCRHRAHDGPRRLVTNSRRPPRGYEREFDLGLVHRFELPGTWPLPDGLGYVEEFQLPLLEALELRREAGDDVLVAGPDDPLYATAEPVERLGWIEGFPLLPRHAPRHSSVWRVLPLWRTADRAAWRHDYAAGGERPKGAVALGALWPTPGPDFVALERHAPGHLRSELLPGAPARAPRDAAQWVAAPLRWSRSASALRAAGSRARHLARTARGATTATTLGFLRRAPAPGWSPLFAARHPALPDTFATRSELEAHDLGYRVLGVLGYVCDLYADRDPAAQPHEILWGSRFGHGRRYVEGPAR